MNKIHQENMTLFSNNRNLNLTLTELSSQYRNTFQDKTHLR